MADRHWVGGTASWDATAGTKWSLTAGGTGNQAIPTASDDVFFDASSGAVTVTLAATANCRSINFTGFPGTFSHGAFQINVGTSTAPPSNIAAKLVSGMTYTATNATSSSWSFTSTNASATMTVDFAGKTTGNVTFNCATTSGYQLVNGSAVSPVHVGGSSMNVGHTQGTLDLNGQTVTWGSLSCTGGSTRTLTMGSSTVNLIGGNATILSMAAVATLTLNANTSSINLTGANAVMNVATTSGTSKTFNNVTFSGSGTCQFSGTATFNNLTITNTATKTDLFQCPGTPTITGTFTVTGNSLTNRHMITSATKGTAVTITAAAVALTNTDFQDITGAGAATWSGTSLGDCLGNTNITFTTPVTRYWRGDSLGALWSNTSSWSASSGGATGATVPLAQDTVIFDNSSLTINRANIQFDMRNLCVDLQMSAMTSWTISLARTAANFVCIFYGNVDLSRITTVATATWTFPALQGRGTHNFTPTSSTSTPDMSVNCVSGTYTLQAGLTCAVTSNFTLTSGTFVTNNQAVTTGLFSSSGTVVRALTLGTTTWTLAGTGNVWQCTTSTNLTLTATSGTLKISDTSATGKAFIGGGLTYGALQVAGNSTGIVTISGNNSFVSLSLSAAGTVPITYSGTPTITLTGGASAHWAGTAGNLPVITGAHTISSATRLSTDYISLASSTGSGGTPFYAGTNSTDGTGNTNWLFSAPPNSAPQMMTMGMG